PAYAPYAGSLSSTRAVGADVTVMGRGNSSYFARSWGERGNGGRITAMRVGSPSAAAPTTRSVAPAISVAVTLPESSMYAGGVVRPPGRCTRTSRPAPSRNRTVNCAVSPTASSSAAGSIRTLSTAAPAASTAASAAESICWAAASAAGAVSTSTTSPATNATLESCIGPAPAILRRVPTTGRPYTASHAGCLDSRRSSTRARIAGLPRPTLLALPSPWSIGVCAGGEAGRAMADRAEERTIRLQVAGAKPQDVGRSTARLPSDALRSLGLREGDV